MHDKVLVHMIELSNTGHQFGFRRAIWLWKMLARYCGYHRQEFAMEKKNEIQVYVKPNGVTVIRAFTLKEIIFYNKNGMTVKTDKVIEDRDLAKQVGQEYEI